MRPLRLELSGFTCFRDHTVIDFSDLELFAIVGQTGAGKSSILDAMTFALFEKTPRLGNKPAKELMSQGSLGMSLALEFEAADGRTYRVARTYTQKSSEPRFERKDQGKWVTVSEKTKKTDIASAIESVVGLDFEAFTKAVLLPQGEFDRFLRGKPEERRNLLKSLIGLDRIEAMQKRAGELSREAKSQSAALQIQLESLAHATPEALETLFEQLEQNQQTLQQTQIKLEQARLDFAQAQEIERLSLQFEQAKLDLGRLEQQESSIQSQKQRVLEARQVAAILPLLDNTERLQARYNEQQRIFGIQQKQLEQAQAQTQNAQAVLEAARDAALKSHELERKIEHLSALLPRVERLKALGGNLENTSTTAMFSETAWSDLERLESELPQLERLNKQLADLERQRQQLEASKTKLELAQTAFLEQENAFKTAKDDALSAETQLELVRIAAQEIPALEKALRQLEDLRPQLERLQQIGGSLADASPTAPVFSEAIWARLALVQNEQKTLLKLQKDQAKYKADLETARDAVLHWSSQNSDSADAVESAKQAGQEKKAELETLERELESAKRENAVAALLQDVQIGDPCPICGQPLRTIPQLGNTLSEFQLRVEIAKRELEQLREKFTSLRETASSHKAALQNAEKSCERAEEALAANKLEQQQLRASWADVLPANDDPKSALQHAKAAQVSGLAFALQQAGAAEIESRIQDVRTQKQKLQQREQQAVQNHTQALSALARAESAWAAAQALLQSRQIERAAAQQEGLRLEQQRLDLSAERSNLQQKIEATLGNQTEPRLALRQTKTALLAGLAHELIQAGATPTLLQDINALKLERRQLESAEQSAKEGYSSAKADLAAAQATAQAAQQALRTAQADSNNATQALQTALAALGFESATVRAKALPENEIQQLESSIAKHQQALLAAQRKIQDVQQELAGRSLQTPVAEFAVVVQQLEQQTQTLHANLGRLETEQQQLKAQIQNVKDLRRTQNAYEKRMDTYGVLALDLRGNEFQDFLLAGVQQQLLARATQTMQRISKQRYSLELIESEFQVRDAWNGLEARGVKTLSGGESFIASLCLALSLSDYLAGNQALGALFLDEGFGTLDADALEMVAGTLEGLNTTGRMVGVITHVPSLASRLPVRLVIEKLQDSSRVKFDRD